MRLRFSYFIVTAASLSFALPATAQLTCDEPISNEWLREGPSYNPHDEWQPISADYVRPVVHEIPRAISILTNESAVKLSKEDFRRFTGTTMPDLSDSRLRPYLVRAVFPTKKPKVEVAWWKGTGLYVFAGGLGCVAYFKQPIVVLLDREPKQVFVSAMSAL